MYRKKKGMIVMTGSNARVINVERKEIVMTSRKRRNSLAGQKLAGAVMLLLIFILTVIGGELSATAIVAPMALAALFSRRKVMDFGIFSERK